MVIAATFLLVALAGSGVRFLEFSTDYQVFFSDENPQLTAFQALQDTYTKNDNLLIVLAPESGDVFTPEVFEAIIDVTERAWQTPHSLRVDSLSNYQHTLYVLFSRKDQGSVIKGIDGENLGSYHILKPRACT